MRRSARKAAEQDREQAEEFKAQEERKKAATQTGAFCGVNNTVAPKRVCYATPANPVEKSGK